MSELKTAVEVAQALERGEVVEYAHVNSMDWMSLDPNDWNWRRLYRTYRIKPKPLECWVNVYPGRAFNAYPSKALAIANDAAEGVTKPDLALRVAVHMREVTND